MMTLTRHTVRQHDTPRTSTSELSIAIKLALNHPSTWPFGGYGARRRRPPTLVQDARVGHVLRCDETSTVTLEAAMLGYVAGFPPGWRFCMGGSTRATQYDGRGRCSRMQCNEGNVSSQNR
jgi:hypothetical protein